MFIEHCAPPEREIARQRAQAFGLIFKIYKIAHQDPAVADLRELLRECEMG
jgi:hypothetical protein